MDSKPTFNSKDFRQALGMFATGVTIVTARAADGTPVGMTANSFNSVSLEPPMVLWSLAKNSRSLPVFNDADHWNVHILSNDQNALSNRFARAGEDKFSGLTLDAGMTEAPLLPNCSARFQCKTMFRYEGGDHIIFVGEVISYDQSARPPLLYVTGGYALATRLSEPIATDAQVDTGASLFSEELLGYLLGRAHYQFMHGFRHILNQHGLSDPDFFLLSLFSIRESLSADEIAAHTAYTGIDVEANILPSLLDRQLVRCTSGTPTIYAMSARGREAIIHVLAAAKSVEADLIDRLGPLEAASLRNLLKRSIVASDPGLPRLWTAK